MSLIHIRPSAVVVGIIVDIVGSVVVGVILGIVIAIAIIARGPFSQSAFLAIKASVLAETIGLIGTTVSTCIGAYVASRLAGEAELWNAIAVGVAALVVGLVLAVLVPSATPGWKVAAGMILTLPAALLGGWLAGRWPSRKPTTA